MKNDYLLDALISKLQGEVKLSKANIQVYLENPVGIGAVSYTHLTLPTKRIV